MTAFPAVLTAPETNTFVAYDGILVTHLDDGGMVALGHHDVDKAETAFNRHGDCWDEPQKVWAVLDREGREIDGEMSPWCIRWGGVTEDTPGAFPVMVVEA